MNSNDLLHDIQVHQHDLHQLTIKQNNVADPEMIKYFSAYSLMVRKMIARKLNDCIRVLLRESFEQLSQ